MREERYQELLLEIDIACFKVDVVKEEHIEIQWNSSRIVCVLSIDTRYQKWFVETNAVYSVTLWMYIHL